MDLLTKTPGLQHVAEEIFQNLNVFTLERCEQVSKSWKAILRKPSFWLQKCRKNDGDDSNKIRNAWKMAISMVKKKEDIKLEENLCDHLKMICKGHKALALSKSSGIRKKTWNCSKNQTPKLLKANKNSKC